MNLSTQWISAHSESQHTINLSTQWTQHIVNRNTQWISTQWIVALSVHSNAVVCIPSSLSEKRLDFAWHYCAAWSKPKTLLFGKFTTKITVAFMGRLTVTISKARVLAVTPLLSSLAENALVDVEEQKRYETFDFSSKNSAVLRWP